MQNYYRIMMGKGGKYINEAKSENYIGIGWLPDLDLNSELTEDWREFNKKMIPVIQKLYPEKSKISAGLAGGFTHTVAMGINIGDIILSPNGKGEYMIGEVIGEYEYHKGKDLPHRRPIKWYQGVIERSEMSQELRNSAGSIATVANISKYADEIDNLISGNRPGDIVATDESIEDPSTFALEKHLEEFLVQNWQKTELGKKYQIYKENGELIGQQYPSDTGPIDILAISKDKKELLVVELKKGRASDVVVGQIQRYMGYVKNELADKNQKVFGAIIAFEDELSLSRALSVAQNINFYTYKINFKLEKK